ncbi:glycoside hydrolase family 127 protein [Paenibacillus sp. 23TSA30-6]|uniref:glycoside hydrolase family 127 protein n=1 Tax=Paenibacillus sp. 23TSA30-6 TaxID=2546104 RepID=UPI0017879CC4|nr:glycoside hydrolase family 127 protein [Paenibacillus sp. 23TSA30-6]MBE0337342.1 glycosyl hydrolase [Paenibacillus sp. 23TSA30-6]
MKAEAFDLHNVSIDSGPLLHAMELNAAYLLSLEPDRLLSRFREYAGLEPKAAHYEGWESRGISGHTLGHYLSGCSLMFASTGDEKLLERVHYVIDELEICQNNHGNGYISGIPRGKELFEEVKAGDIRSQGFDLNGGWVPLYTMHKLFAGLRDAHLLAHHPKALQMEIKLGDWLEDVFQGLNDDQVQQVLHCEFGGMNEVLTDLAEHSGEERFLKLAERFYHGEVLNDLAENHDTLAGRHANTQIPKIIGAARQYEMTGKPQYADLSRFFWDRVVHKHSYVIGGNSYNEHFGEPGKLNDRLGEGTCETCNTYNMLKLTRHMFEWDAYAAYADYYERAMFNHILASQQPIDGRVCYFVSLEMGGHKSFNSQYEDFTCCVGSGMESHSMYGTAIYFHTPKTIYVNQYVPSTVTWDEMGVQLKQETLFPQNGRGTLRVISKEPKSFAIKLRCPHWAEQGIIIKINGEEFAAEACPTSYVVIEREWNDGDTVEYDIPMTVRVEEMPDNPRRIAFMYGPLVLAGDLGPVEQESNEEHLLASVLVGATDSLTSKLVPDGNKPNVFRMNDLGYVGDLELRPFYQMYDRSYTVYWDLFSKEEWASTEAEYRTALAYQLQLERLTVDVVQPAEMQPERDHAFTGEHVSLGSIYNRKYRDTWPGGWFSFVMKILPDEPVQLAVTYLKDADRPYLDFDIIADGQILEEGKLESEEMNKFETFVYELPLSVTAQKDEVTIQFKAHPLGKVAKVTGLRVIRHSNAG